MQLAAVLVDHWKLGAGKRLQLGFVHGFDRFGVEKGATADLGREGSRQMLRLSIHVFLIDVGEGLLRQYRRPLPMFRFMSLAGTLELAC